MNKLKLATAITLALATTTASADFLGFYVGVQKWNHDIDGSINSLGNSIDVNNDLGLSDGDEITKYFAFEHPVPLIPNFMIRQVDLRGVSNGNASQAFTFQNASAALNDPTQLSYNLDHDEYTLYYEILDNWVNLDLGISTKQFDGSVFVGANLGSNNASSASVAISGSVPMIYGKAQFDLPFTGLSAGGQVQLGQFNDDKLSDMSAYIAYEGEAGFGLELGYRIFELEFDDFDQLSSDLTIDGFYAGLSYHF